MTAFLIDTNVLLRLVDSRSAERGVAATIVERLKSNEIRLYVCAQVLAEFWAVATRPEAANGLGWPPSTAAEVMRGLRKQFAVLPDEPASLDAWFDIVERCQVRGKRAHDARIAALLVAHGIKQLLTFNTSDFPSSWGITAVHPAQVI